MSNRSIKAILFLITVSGGGYALYKTVTPTEDESRKRLGKAAKSKTTDGKESRSLTMERLRRYADVDKKS